MSKFEDVRGLCLECRDPFSSILKKYKVLERGFALPDEVCSDAELNYSDFWDDELFNRHLYDDKIIGYISVRTGRSVVEAAQAGCGLCLMIENKLGHRLWATRSNLDIASLESLKCVIHPGLRRGFVVFCIDLHCSELQDIMLLELCPLGAMCAHTGHTDWFATFRKCEELRLPTGFSDYSCSTGSESSLKLAVAWLNECSEHHARCVVKREPPEWYPTRLLEISPGEKEPQLRLVVSDCSSVNGPYMTLSHCWGEARPLTLTTTNFESFRKIVEWKVLPQTFRDAIIVTRACGIRYLWIDSLCILQDSIEDWRNESSLMGQVYKKCFSNIAAAFSTDCHGGLFVTRDRPAVGPVLISLATAGLPPEPLRCVDRDKWTECVDYSPLNQRAWVLQERLLAPRILYFGNDQLYFECRVLRADQASPFGIPIHDINQTKELLSEPSRNRLSVKREHWPKVVCAYTGTSLTYERDKLVAISALAEELHGTTGDHYLAGLWRGSLIRDLRWHTTAGKRPRSYRAPSWSWASIDGAVHHWYTRRYLFDDPPYCRLIEVIDARTSPIGADKFGEIEDGYLRLSGFLGRARFTAGETKEAFSLMIDGKIFRLLQAGDSVTFWPDDVAYVPVGDVYCLPITWGVAGDWLEGLVLTPTNESKQQFRRVGFFVDASIKVDMRMIRAQGLELKFSTRKLIKFLLGNFSKLDPLFIHFVTIIWERKSITII